MGWKNREIEIKLIVTGAHALASVVKDVTSFVEKIFPAADQINGNAFDLYWDAPKEGSADFIRLRKTPEGAQITLKSTDRTDNTDRVEIDLHVNDYIQARTLMLAAHGTPAAKIQKKYTVFFLENEDTTFSVYQIKDDTRVFVEIEGRTKKRVKELTKGFLENTDKECRWVRSSLYQVFVKKEEPRIVNIPEFLDN